MNEHAPDDHAHPDAFDPAFVPRPKWPTPFGVISIVLGALGLVCGGIGLAWGMVAGPMMKDQLDGAPMPDVFVLGPIDLAVAAASLALSVVLIFAGILLIGRSPKARLLHVLFAVLILPVNIVGFVRQMDKQAALERWLIDYPDNPLAQSMNQPGQQAGQQAGEVFGLAMFVVLGVLYPLFVFVWFAAIKHRPEQITGTQDGVY